MQFKEIKRLVKSLGPTVLIEEDGSGLVVLPLAKYLELLGRQAVQDGEEEEDMLGANGANLDGETAWRMAVPGSSTEQDLLAIEKLNQDIAMLKEEIKKRELEELEDDAGSGTVD